MKRILPLLAALCCLVACNNNEPTPTKSVTFHVDAFHIAQEPMKAPHATR